MTKKSVSGGWKALVLLLLILPELILCAGILGNIESVCNLLTAHGMDAVNTFLHRALFFLIEVGAAVLLIVDTVVVSITKVTKQFPSLMTVLAFVYNDIAVIATVFGLYMFGQPRAWFPYPLAFLIPAITFLLALICLIDDFRRDKGVIEEAPNVTKMAAQQTVRTAPAAPVAETEVEAPPIRLEERPVAAEEDFLEEKTTFIPTPVKEEEPAFYVTPATEEQWTRAVETEPEVVPATESVEVPVYHPLDTEPVVTSAISKDNVAADAIAAVDDLFFAFSDSEFVEDETEE